MSARNIEQERCDAVALLIEQVRQVMDGAVDRTALSRVETLLAGLAGQAGLWAARELPDPPAESRQMRYLVHEEPDQSLALYLMVMRKGKRTPIHDHRTWACIAAVEGAETNHLYRRLDDGSVSGHADVEPAGTRVVRPGHSLSFLPEDIHAVSIDDDDLIRHLHLYGRALETLHDRVVFHPGERRCEPMYIHTPTLRRARGGARAIALGDKVVDGVRWSYSDTLAGDEVLLMLPGAQGNCRAFDSLLDALASRYRLIALSYPALGSAQALAAGVLSFMDAIGVARATVFGTSLGAYVAQWMAASRPDAVGQLVLSNGFSDPTPAHSATELEIVRRQTDAEFKAAAIARLEAAGGGEQQRRMLTMVRAQGGGSLRQRRIAVLTGGAVPPLAIDGSRVAILDADDDPVLPAQMRDDLVARCPGALHRRFPTGGHSLHATRPAEVVDVLLSLAKPDHGPRVRTS